MAERAPSEGEAEGAMSRQESFLDQFLRRLDQTDQEAAASPSSTSGTTMAAPSPSPSSDYSSLSSAANPWTASFMSNAAPHPGSPLNPDLQAAYRSTTSASSPAYHLSATPLTEFPWLLEEFDQHQRSDPDADDSAHRLYSSYTAQEPAHSGQALGGSASGTGSPASSPQHGGRFEPGTASSHSVAKSKIRETSSSAIIHGSSSSSKLDAEPVPRFGDPGSTTTQAPAAGPAPPSITPVASKHTHQNNSRPPTSPQAVAPAGVGAGAGSVTTSAGTSNTSLSSESTSNNNAGDEDESSEVKKEVTSSGKRKKPEADSSAAGDQTPESTTSKPDQPKNKPRKRGGAKRLREPRYAIKTRTDVDVLDDGFKWRKYGQKAVKNSPHPRNYYRCTTPLCPVRKRVERSNEDAGLVITTYEGTHTHQTPGFHRPGLSAGGGYFGDRPLGMGGGLFQSPLGPASTLLPLPPGFDLASLQQATALRNIRGLQPNQINPLMNHHHSSSVLLPGSSNQQHHQQHQQLRHQQQQQLGLHPDSLVRAQQLLGLHDGPPSFTSVKQEPFQFTASTQENFMSRNLSLPSLPGLMTTTEGPFPSQILTRSTSSDHALQRVSQLPAAGGSPSLIFPRLQPSGGNSLNISGPASSSNIGASDNNRSRSHIDQLVQQPPGAGVVGGSSRHIDESLETLVSSSSGHANFNVDHAQGAGGAGPADQGSTRSSSQNRGGQQTRTSAAAAPTMQQHQQHHQQQQQQQHSIRPVTGLSATISSENLQGQGGASESESVGAREGLLQDMVRHGGPKVSKS